MPASALKAKPSQWRAVMQDMSAAQIERLMHEMQQRLAKLRETQTRGSILKRRESELLQKINQGIPAGLQARYTQLQSKRRAGRLTSAEHEELLDLIQKAETQDVERLRHLTALARLRGEPLKVLMRRLGIETRAHVETTH